MTALSVVRGVKKTSLASWIAEAASDDDKDGGLSALSLQHSSNAGEREIHTTRLAAGKQWTAESLGEMFLNKAKTYAQDLPGVQTFVLLAFYGGKSEAQASHPFTISGATDWGLATEGPDARGQMQQGMRLTEAIVQGTFRQLGTLLDKYERMVTVLGDQNARLVQENRDAFEIVKEMLMKKALDDHELRMKEKQFERDTVERKKWLSFAPALINTLLGREVFPQSSADTALVETIAESLTPEDVTKLSSAGVLKPELMGPLMGRMTQILAAKEAEKAAINEALAKVTPEDDEVE